LESLPGEFAENLESSVPDNQTLQVFSTDDVIFFGQQSLRARTDGRYIAKIYRPRTELKKQKNRHKTKKKRPRKKKRGDVAKVY
jgi:GR25 family glycosyltransferase involved in LPS biosynthesis